MIRRLLVLSCAVLLMESFFSAVLTPLAPSFRRELGLSEGATGILLASYALGSLLLSLPAGWFTSRFNPRNAVVLGLTGVGVSSVLFGFADRIEVLDASRFLLGGFGALMWTGGMSWMVSAAPVARRGTVMGALMAAAVAGEFVGAPIGALADDVGTEIVFGSVALIAAGLIMLALTVPPVAEAAGQTAREALAAVRRRGPRRFAAVLVVIGGPCAATGLVMVLLPLRFDEIGVSAWYLAAALTVMALVETVIGPLAGRASDRVGRLAPYVAGLVSSALALLLLGGFGGMWVLVLALPLAATGGGLAFTPALAMISDLATDAGLNQGYSSALSSIGWAGGFILGAVGGGFLIGASGAAVAALATLALLGVAALVARHADVPLPVGAATAA